MGDAIAGHKDYEDPVEILSEAYYSIGCDYLLSYRLQRSRYRELQAAG